MIRNDISYEVERSFRSSLDFVVKDERFSNYDNDHTMKINDTTVEHNLESRVKEEGFTALQYCRLLE